MNNILKCLFKPAEPEDNTLISGMRIHQLVYEYCIASPSKAIPLRNEIIEFGDVLCREILVDLVANGDDRLRRYQNHWKRYRDAAHNLDLGASYLNKFLKTNYKKEFLTTLEGHLFLLWQSNILNVLKLSHGNCLMRDILAAVKNHREGKEIADEVIKDCIASLVQVKIMDSNDLKSIYEDEFEQLYLEESRKYYCQEATSLAKTLEINDFVASLSQRLTEEQKLCSLYLEESSTDLAIQIFDEEYIGKYLLTLQKGLKESIVEESIAKSKPAFTLINRITSASLEPFSTFQTHIEGIVSQMARESNPSSKEPAPYIEHLSRLRSRFLSFCNATFPKESAFQGAIDKAYRKIFAQPKLIQNFIYPITFAKYLDSLLKKSTTDEAVLQEKINQVLELFNYLDEKDVFQTYHSRFLAKRLIYKSSFSEDLELEVLQKLTLYCGSEYTQKMQRMFTDVTLSKEINASFKQQKNLSLVAFDALVLQTGSWPIPLDTFSLPIPEEIAKAMASFKEFYLVTLSKTGRKLIWNESFSRGEVSLTYLEKEYTLSLSLKPLVMILNFNDKDSISLNEIQNLTGAASSEAAKLLKPFCELGILLLKEDESQYSLDFAFQSKRLKIKLPASQAEPELKDDAALMKKAIDEDRLFFLQAAIVRIMKAKKTMTYNQLIDELITQSKPLFRPKIPSIKKTVEELIEKEYLERSSENVELLSYIT